MQTRDTLRRQIAATLKGRLFVVASNREPYLHEHSGNGVVCLRPASGVALALDPVAQASGGLWVAHGAGTADREMADEAGRVRVPPEDPTYTLKRVWLTKQQEEDYYYGFANSALWPLCHLAYRRPVFRDEHWNAYREVNTQFADAIAEEIGSRKAFVFVQDYHFALLPRLLKERVPQAVVAQFWHIPWPNAEVFRICPWTAELLEGMLGNDMLGFHIRQHSLNFIHTVENELEARSDPETNSIVFQGHTTRLRTFPISVDFAGIEKLAGSKDTEARVEELRRKYRLPRENLGLGVDRLDYTKGIPERLVALDRFLEHNPDYRGRFTFLQVAPPSRVHVEEYRRLVDEVDRLVEQVNWKYRDGSWQPIVYLKEHIQQPVLYALYRMARFCLVSPLHDGMNLVAKEFVAANVDESGVLLLSRFTGASRQLSEALIINPYAADEVAEQIRVALEMDVNEVRWRMRRLRERVREDNIYHWATEVIKRLGRLG
ncbi:MAG: trehalose-6-phosphate synthase [Terriglobia bacterium]